MLEEGREGSCAPKILQVSFQFTRDPKYTDFVAQRRRADSSALAARASAGGKRAQFSGKQARPWRARAGRSKYSLGSGLYCFRVERSREVRGRGVLDRGFRARRKFRWACRTRVDAP
jgi:hypothetical protein